MADVMISNSELDRLLSERDIFALENKYTRGVDRLDLEMVRSCYHPDATDDHGEYVGGVDGFIEWLAQILPPLEISQHFIGNFLVDVRGDEAFAELYVHSHTRLRDENGEPVNRIRCVRFYDRLARRDGTWLIADRHVVFDWAQTTPIEGDMWGSHPRSGDAGAAAEGPGNAGTNGPADPSAAYVDAWRKSSASDASWL
jgi:hypothetical protein